MKEKVDIDAFMPLDWWTFYYWNWRYLLPFYHSRHIHLDFYENPSLEKGETKTDRSLYYQREVTSVWSLFWSINSYSMPCVLRSIFPHIYRFLVTFSTGLLVEAQSYWVKFTQRKRNLQLHYSIVKLHYEVFKNKLLKLYQLREVDKKTMTFLTDDEYQNNISVTFKLRDSTRRNFALSLDLQLIRKPASDYDLMIALLLSPVYVPFRFRDKKIRWSVHMSSSGRPTYSFDPKLRWWQHGIRAGIYWFLRRY